MPKLKSSWVITDIPKDIKVKLWRFMKDNPTYKSWEKAIVGKSYTTDQDEIITNVESDFIKMSKDTYNSLKKEVLLMPQEEVETLPEDLKRWVMSVRPELKVYLRPSDSSKTLTVEETVIGEERKQLLEMFRQRLQEHLDELAKTALRLASNLEKYLSKLDICFDLSDPIGDVVYVGWLDAMDGKPDALSVRMAEVDRSLALNLLLHLKSEGNEFPELANISDWAQLTGGRISDDFVVERLRLKADHRNFSGGCPGCPPKQDTS